MTFHADVTVEDGVCVCVLRGELDMSTEATFDQRLRGLEAQSPKVLVLDFGEITFMDSSGLRALLRARQRAESEGHRLILARPARHVERVLELTGARQWFDITSDPSGREVSGSHPDGEARP